MTRRNRKLIPFDESIVAEYRASNAWQLAVPVAEAT
jgi:hypothetical protein